MADNANSPDLSHVESSFISAKARQIIGRAGFRSDDQPDLEQELKARLIRGLKQFDPDRGHRFAFVIAVVERAASNLMRDASAVKRTPGAIVSLNVVVDVSEDVPTELSGTVSDREQNARRRIEPRSAEELQDLHIDLEDVLATLPDHQRHLCRELMTKTKSQVAREQGLPPSTLQDQVQVIRQRFERAGLRIYL